MKSEIIPVVHMLNRNQVLTNVRTCIECGIKKVFLINHAVSIEDLIECAHFVKSKYPELWVGINMLGSTTQEAISMDLPFDGLWCDQTISSKESSKYRKFKGLFFGGLAFKYQPQPVDLEDACLDSISAYDVSTTSGIGTGKAANVDKVKRIKNLLGGHPMAIASGISIDNIDDYIELADYLLVASSITSSSEMISKDRLLQLVNKSK